MQQFTTPTGIACVVMAALLLAGLTAWGLSYVFAVRRYEMGAGNAFTALGMPAWLTQGLFSLAIGDKVRGFEQLEQAADRAVTQPGIAEIDLGYVAAARANPARWPAFLKLVQDADGNASQQQLQSDAAALAKTSPMLAVGNLPTPIGVLASDVSSFAGQLAQTAQASHALAAHPQLQALHDSVSANPALASQLGTVMSLASAAAAHTVNALAPASAPANSDPGTSAPAPSTGMNISATNVLPGHVITASAVPGSPAAAASAS